LRSLARVSLFQLSGAASKWNREICMGPRITMMSFSSIKHPCPVCGCKDIVEASSRTGIRSSRFQCEGCRTQLVARPTGQVTLEHTDSVADTCYLLGCVPCSYATEFSGLVTRSTFRRGSGGRLRSDHASDRRRHYSAAPKLDGHGT
jgi:transposase-like protein